MQFSTGKHALGICDRCGFRYGLSELKPLVIRTNKTGLLVCPDCWEPSHPQLEVGAYPVHDPQTLRDSRPDTALTESRKIYWGWKPLQGVNGEAQLGAISVVTT